MDYTDLVQIGLDGSEPLKIILCGRVECNEKEKIGVVEVVYASMNVDNVRAKINELNSAKTHNYYMVYSVPFDTDLSQLSHYPSIQITKEDLA